MQVGWIICLGEEQAQCQAQAELVKSKLLVKPVFSGTHHSLPRCDLLRLVCIVRKTVTVVIGLAEPDVTGWCLGDQSSFSLFHWPEGCATDFSFCTA